MLRIPKGFAGVAIGLAAAITTLHLAPVALAQRGADWEWQGSYDHLTRLNPGTYVSVRTSQAIESNRTDGRIFSGVVAEDVWDDYRRLAVPAIPRGSRVELIVRTAPDRDLILDLDSIYAHGQRYAVNATTERIQSEPNHPSGNDTATAIGGGALLGAIIGSIAGGGKGAAIGAAAGAATGLGLVYHGQTIRVPAGSVLTFRLDAPLAMGIRDEGYTRGQQHYHPYQGGAADYPSGRR